MRTWSQQRIAIAIALFIWASVFWFLIVLDRTPLYFSARTTWLAPLGAVTLTIALIGRLLTARASDSEPVSGRYIRRLTVLVLPAIVVMVVPPPTLGSYAIGKRSNQVSAGGYVSPDGRDLSTGDLSLKDIFSLTYNGELDRLSERAGSTSSFVGFVSEGNGGADEFVLSRFMISCCPGDAVPIQVRVVGAEPGTFQTDDWVRVTGAIYPIDQQLVLDVTDIEKVERPDRPYLN